MDKYSYCDEIKDKFNIDDLNSATLKYRLDGFITACNMDLENSIPTKEISITRTPYINIKNDEENLKYDINFSYHYNKEDGKNFVLTGDYNKLLFKLGIRDFTSISNSITGKHVRITVKPNQRKNNDSMQIPRKIGDYINSEYGDDKGTIFNNPKNGHTRRLNKFGKFI